MAELKTDAQALSSGNWFIAESFSFGVEREMKESNEKGGTETPNADTSEPQASNFIVEFDRPVDSSPLGADDLAHWQNNYGTGHAADEGGSKDSFVFENSTSGASPMVWDNVKNDGWTGSEFDPLGRLLVGTDGGVWRDVDGDLSLPAVDTGGIPVSLPEYGLFLF
jgi:hypothetical protein